MLTCRAGPQVQVVDAWGNATCPTKRLAFGVQLDSPALEPACSMAAVDERCVPVHTRSARHLPLPRASCRTSRLCQAEPRPCTCVCILCLPCRGIATIQGCTVQRPEPQESGSQAQAAPPGGVADFALNLQPVLDPASGAACAARHLHPRLHVGRQAQPLARAVCAGKGHQICGDGSAACPCRRGGAAGAGAGGRDPDAHTGVWPARSAVHHAGLPAHPVGRGGAALRAGHRCVRACVHGLWAQNGGGAALSLSWAERACHPDLQCTPVLPPPSCPGLPLPGHAGPDGEVQSVWQLQGIQAGSRVGGLVLRCLDEAQRPAATEIRGKLMVRPPPSRPPHGGEGCTHMPCPPQRWLGGH